MAKYTQHLTTKNTPATEALPGQIANNGGGFSFQIDDWKRLDRFLILGSEGGTFYVNEKKLTKDSAKCVERCIKADGLRTVQRLVEVSDQGLAAKNDAALLALAMCAKLGDDETRRAAYAALPKVARIGTHLFHFAEYMELFGGWGRGAKTAVGRWYTGKSVEDLAYQMVKYQSRDKWSNRDMIRLAHVKAPNDEYNTLFRWAGAQFNEAKAEAARGQLDKALYGDLSTEVPNALRIVWAFERAKRATDVDYVVRLIREHGLPREGVPTQFLNDIKVWDALLEKMGMTAMIRNLATMTRVGLIAPLSDATKTICERLTNQSALVKGRIHPMSLLIGLKTYAQGRGMLGQNTWHPNQKICDALDSAFYLAFKAVVPANKRFVLALDVSGSMDGGFGGSIKGCPSMTAREASCAMSLVTAATEPATATIAFSSGSRSHNFYNTKSNNPLDGVSEVDISPRDRLDTVNKKSRDLSIGMGATDISLPFLWAQSKGVKADVFVIYTDNECNSGLQPVVALQEYRRATGINAKLIVVGITATEMSVGDQQDPGTLDVVGMDASVPAVMADFARK